MGFPAFDGLLDEPTYRFVRGEESQPDKSSPLDPDIPGIVAFEPLRIAPVELPAVAWQPERRGWVVESYREAALRKLADAEAKLGPAHEKLQSVERNRSESASARNEAEKELEIATLRIEAALAELQSVERRAEAMRATWNRSSDGSDAGAESAEKGREVARDAALAERKHATARG